MGVSNHTTAILREAMEREKLGLMGRMIAAWNANDYATMESLLAEDFVGIGPEEWPERVTATDWPTARRQMEVLKDSWDEEWIEAREVRVKGDRVAGSARWRGRGSASGVELDMPLAVLFEVQEGKISHVQFFLDFDRAVAGLEG